MSDSTTNKADWEKNFRELDILGHIGKSGYFDITAPQIKKHGYHREPRLMTKVDFREHQPGIMADSGLSILAISNGSYLIARTDPFIDVAETLPSRITTVRFPRDLLTLAPTGISSESNALDFYIVDRQIDYYYNTQKFMGLANSNRENIWLSERGRDIARFPHRKKLQEMARIIFSEPIFNSALKSGVDALDTRLFSRWGVGGSTIPRRKKTVRSWIEFFREALEG